MRRLLPPDLLQYGAGDRLIAMPGCIGRDVGVELLELATILQALAHEGLQRIAGQLQAENPRDLIPALLESTSEPDGSPLDAVFPMRFAPMLWESSRIGRSGHRRRASPAAMAPSWVKVGGIRMSTMARSGW